MDKRPATEVFHDWALVGKDEGMERGHAASVSEMIEFISQKVPEPHLLQLMSDAVMAGWLDSY